MLPKPLKRLHQSIKEIEPYIGLFVLGGGVAVVSKFSSLFGNLNWADAVLVGLASALILMLSITFSLALWRFFRPLPTLSPAKEDNLLSSDEWQSAKVKIKNLEVEISNHKEEMKRSDQRVAIISEGFSKSIEKSKHNVSNVNKKLETFISLTDGSSKQTEKLADLVTKQIEDKTQEWGENKEFQEKSEAMFDQMNEKIRTGFDHIDQGFAAIHDREQLLLLADELETEAEILSGPTNGDAIADFEDWSKQCNLWRKKLERWSRIGVLYRHGLIEKVHETPESQYKGKWKATDDLFPDSTAVHTYRTFRILYKNFKDERDIVEGTVRLAAFASPSMKGRPKPVRGPDCLPLPPKD